MTCWRARRRIPGCQALTPINPPAPCCNEYLLCHSALILVSTARQRANFVTCIGGYSRGCCSESFAMPHPGWATTYASTEMPQNVTIGNHRQWPPPLSASCTATSGQRSHFTWCRSVALVRHRGCTVLYQWRSTGGVKVVRATGSRT